MSKSTPMVNLVIATIFTIFTISSASSNEPHIINFRFPNLYPESLTWDPSAQHFIVSSLRHTLLHSISDASAVDTLVSDPSLPSSTSLYGITLDTHRRRLLAAVHSNSSPPFSALASYDLRLFLAPLPDPTSASSAAGVDDVAVDFLACTICSWHY